MTKDKALHKFFYNYDINAYPTTAVPDDAKMPYLVYEPSYTEFGDSAEITVRLFYRTDSEAIPNAKAEEICSSLRHGGVLVDCDGGKIWVKVSTPAWLPVPTEDNSIKCRAINLTLEFLAQ